MLVATDGDKLFGVATVSFNLGIRFGGEYAQLEELYVSPQARGQNAGALLVRAIIDAAKTRGCAEIGLYLVESTTHNRPFYEKLGFRTVGDEMRQPLG
jgi:GNAT superfamily N-acetyltransferase